MRLDRFALIGVLLASLAACGGAAVDAPEALDPAGPHRNLSSNPNCPSSGYECADAVALGPAYPDLNVIAANCPEACQLKGTGTPLSLTIDADPFLNDVVRVRCPSGVEADISSSHPCWDCRESCAGANCPPGATCVTIKGTPGSDCQAYKCDAGWARLDATTCRTTSSPFRSKLPEP